MKTLIKLASACLLLCITMSGCGSTDINGVLDPYDETTVNGNNQDADDQDRVATERKTISLNDTEKKTAADLTKFYMEFTSDMAAYIDGIDDREDGNVIVSPLSMAILLSMMSNGVAPDYQQYFFDYLGSTDRESLNNVCAQLLKELPKADDLASLNIANSIWLNSLYGLTLTDDYASVLKNVFESEVKSANFNDGKTIDLLNAWCNEKTHGLIPDFFKNSPEGFALLLNVIYFKNYWAGHIFNKENTHSGVFHGKLKDSNVDMMQSEEYYGLYAKSNNASYFTIPFGNEAFSLEIIIPDAANGNFQPTVEEMEEIMGKAVEKNLKVKLPKFKLDQRNDVSDMFDAIGKSSLTSNVECEMFKELSEQLVNVIYRQGTSFTVDEAGAEMAAVSSAEIFTSAGPDFNKPIQIDVDRPFWFFIREFSTGACILSGRIATL